VRRAAKIAILEPPNRQDDTTAVQTGHARLLSAQ
jgi:hypothetical protein